MPLLLGTAPNQVPTNGDLGTMAFQDSNAIGGDVSVGGNLTVSGTGTNSLTGNVGIGTSAPTARLELTTDSLNQGIRIYRPLATSGGGYEGILFALNNTSGTKTDYASISANSTIATTGSEAGSISFKTFGLGALTEKMRLDSSGNLGIGTTTPVTTLHAQSAGATLGGLTNIVSAVYDTATTTGIKAVLGFGTTNGTSSPLHGAIGAVRETVTASDGQGGLSFYTRPSGGGSLSERMRLDSSGNLGVGTTANSSAILDAQSTTKGVRMPNMTTTQKNAIASPAAGLMVFDTTLSKLCVYTGAAWQTITSA